MDRPFNQGHGRGQYPMSPQTPTGGNAYQVNVNRTKTKKWVDAKVQSYDGDDWGADESEEESEPVPAPPMSQPPVHATGSRGSSLPSLQTRHPIVSSAPSSNSKTGAVPEATGPSPSRVAPRSHDQAVSPSSADNTYGSGVLASYSQSTITPHSKEAAAADEKIASPSDIRRGLGEEKQQRQPPLDSSQSNPTTDLSHAKSETMSKGENFSLGNTTEAPKQDDLVEQDNDRRRLSTSPKLPDFARMSAFGTDLFSSSGNSFSADKPIVEQSSDTSFVRSPLLPKTEVTPAISEAQHIPVTQGLVTEPQVNNAETATAITSEKDEPEASQILAPVPEKHISSIGVDDKAAKTDAPSISPSSSHVLSKNNIPVLHPDSEVQAIAPLRTPSPRGPIRAAPEDQGPHSETPSDFKGDGKKQTESKQEASLELGPIQRKSTLNTVASSPVKDNDTLSDEILKSLSPTGASSDTFDRPATGDRSQPPSRDVARESNYTLKDYDNYWDDTDDKSKVPIAPVNIPRIPAISDSTDASASQPTTSSVDDSTEQLVSPQSSTLRRRFSWEAEEEAAQAKKHLASTMPTSTAPVPKIDENNQQSSPAVNAQSPVDSRKSVDEPSSTIGVSPQVSVGSSQPPTRQQPALEAPSPISTDSDKNLPTARANNRLSLADEKTLAQTSSNIVSSPSPEIHPALVDQFSPVSSVAPVASTSEQPQPQIMSFREIMNLQSPSERIAKYNETRDIFSVTNSGLDNWLSHLGVDHPDVSTTGPLFSAQSHQQVPLGTNSAAQASGNSPSAAQQPYYQQYLNASSPNTASSPTSRSRLGGLPIPGTQVSSSTFGHSGNQIGTKSKVLMHSAGKMGKGLLSKGKSKLRGTGDKGEALSPTDEPKAPRASRRTSWGMSLGLKSRGERDAPQDNVTQDEEPAPPTVESTMVPQIPQIPSAAPLSPLNPTAHSEFMPEWRSSATDSTVAQPLMALRHPAPPTQLLLQSRSQSQSQPGHSSSRVTAGLSRLEIPNSRPLLHNETNSAPLLSLSNSQQNRTVRYDNREASTSTRDHVDRDWVMVSREHPDLHQHHHQHQHSLSNIPPAMEARTDGAAPSGPVLEDSGIGLSQPTQQAEEPKRSSSFIGLPPIRRGSTFALNSKPKARRATDRFPIDDDEDEPFAELSFTNIVPDHEATLQNTSSMSYSSQEPTVLALADNRMNNVTAPAASSNEEGKDGVIISYSEIPQNGRNTREMGLPHHSEVPSAALHEQQSRVHDAMAQSQNPQLMPHPGQRPPTFGPWILEESKLTEPLNSVARNRSGTNGSQQQIMYGFDKETGLPSSESPTHHLLPQQPLQQNVQPPTQQLVQNHMAPPPRQRPGVPPSSAQRWPGLFTHAPDQRPRSNSRNGPQTYQAPYQTPVAYDEFVMPRSQTNEFAIPGVGPLEEDRGRRNRNSRLLKDFGQKIARATSRERRASLDHRPVVANFHGDQASESSIATGSELQDQTGQRPSFLFGRSGRRVSMDQGPRHHAATGEEQSIQEPQPPSAFPQPDKGRSLFGTGVGSKFIPSGLARSSTSNLNHAHSDGPAVLSQNESSDTAPKKKRFSGMARVSNLLNRNKQEDKLEPRDDLAGQLEPPAAPYQRLGRSSTTSSFETASHQNSMEGSPERQRDRRRTSVSGLITGMLGKRAAPKMQLIDPVPPLHTHPQTPMNLQSHHSNNAEPKSPQLDRHQQALVQNIPGPLTSYSTLGNTARDGLRPPPPMDADLLNQPVKPSEPSPLGLIVQHNSQQPSSTHVPVWQAGRGIDEKSLRPEMQQQQHAQQQQKSLTGLASPAQPGTANIEHKPQIDRLGHENVTADGEIMRPSTVSPDLSITSDWRVNEQQPEPHLSESGRNGLTDLDKHTTTPTQANNSQSLTDNPGVVKLTDLTKDENGLPASPATSHKPVLPVQRSVPEQLTSTNVNVQPNIPQQQIPVRAPADPQIYGMRPPPASPHGYGNLMHPQVIQQPQPQYQLQPRPPPQQFQGTPQHNERPGIVPDQPTQISEVNHPSISQQDSRLLAPSPHQGEAPQQGKEGSGFKWKGLTKRVSEQMTGFGQQNSLDARSDKNDKSAGNKFLGAFKRNSKQPDAQNTQPIHMGTMNHPSFQQHGIPPPKQLSYQQPAGQQGFGQHISGHSRPLNLIDDPMSQQHPQPHPQPQPHIQQSPIPTSGPFGLQQTQPYDHRGQQRSVQLEPEPRYDQVPIPRGYTAVHGEGAVVPTPYNVGRHDPNMHRYATQPQQLYAQQGSHVLQQQESPPPISQTSLPRQDSVSAYGMVTPPSAPSVEERRVSQPLGNLRSNPPSNTLPEPQKDLRIPVLTSQNVQQPGLLQPKTSSVNLGKPGADISPDSRATSDNGSVSQQSKSPSVVQVQGEHKANREDMTTPPPRSSTLGLDVAKAKQNSDDDIYDATPRLNKENAGESGKMRDLERSISDDSISEKPKKEEQIKTTKIPAELEDTAGAHARRTRLAAQEEKIWCDPEDDPNFQPQMSATSYPGQEWNPYGDPDFTDWKDE
ncbi:hypothetical protein QQS21_012052 [Conoideocrella luteorostrata]|uniref:SWI-SNF chromatin-remodeling complex protein n=1 Tax=Conoideocrella luteorostrata TaxID=1105319 RepID=A0AAJ0CGG6_9HYPO|nr:hypothetical protein QQS21_012052 [Conoideocrella luteorostrata]